MQKLLQLAAEIMQGAWYGSNKKNYVNLNLCTTYITLDNS